MKELVPTYIYAGNGENEGGVVTGVDASQCPNEIAARHEDEDGAVTGVDASQRPNEIAARHEDESGADVGAGSQTGTVKGTASADVSAGCRNDGRIAVSSGADRHAATEELSSHYRRDGGAKATTA